MTERAQNSKSDSLNPSLSLIVTSYTTERFSDIINLLESAKTQTYSSLEVIVLIEWSRKLFEQVKAYKEISDLRSLRVIFLDSKRGASFARNAGVKEAKGEIVAFVDDDVMLFPDWAENLIKPYRDKSVVAVTGQVLPLWEEKGWQWFPEELDWVFGCSRWLGSNQISVVRSVIGANASFRKEAISLAGGYSTKLGARHLQHQKSHELRVLGEETELSMRVKAKTRGFILHNPYAMLYHKVQRSKLSWRFIFQRTYQVGRTRRIVLKYGGREALSTEWGLIGRMLLELATCKISFSNPVRGLRRIITYIIIIFFVFLGFLTPATMEG